MLVKVYLHFTKTSLYQALNPGNCEEKWFPTSLNEQRNSSFWNINAFTCTQISKRTSTHPWYFTRVCSHLSCVSPFFKYDNMQPPLWSPFQNFASTFPISQSYDRQTKESVYDLRSKINESSCTTKLTQQKQNYKCRKEIDGYQWVRGGINWRTGIDIHTLHKTDN